MTKKQISNRDCGSPAIPITALFFCLLVPIYFISSNAYAGVDDAYDHLYEVMDKFHNTFDVYTDMNAGGNHYYPTGWMGDLSSLIIEENWESNCYSGTSCIKIEFTSANNNWASVYWQYPENNWGTVVNAGYNLDGATELTFWAKGETGNEYINFFSGGIGGSYPDSMPETSTGFIQLSTSWKHYSIPLATLDLSHIIGGFGFELNTPGNPGGATFYLDDIQYNKSRPNDLRFLTSYETVSSSIEPDKILTNTSYIYDNALALIAFLASGKQEDLRRAKILADAFVSVQDNDIYYSDGRLRNAYMSGDLFDHMTGKAKLPGWWDTGDQKWYEDKFNISTHTGNITWTMTALLLYYEKVGGEKYLAAAVEMGEWLENHTRDNQCVGGYTGGYEGWHTNPTKLTWKATEHNIDAYAAFMLLHKATDDAKWRERALHARSFVTAMWNDSHNHFWTGTGEDGCTINTGNIPVDIQAWALMALGEYSSGLLWAENNCYTETDGFKAFDFNNDKDGIWFEGTSQMAVAYQINNQKRESDFYISEVIKAQTSAVNSNGKGIIAASHDGVTTGFDWEYFRRLHVGATAWYVFAEMKHNPYWGMKTTSEKVIPGVYLLLL